MKELFFRKGSPSGIAQNANYANEDANHGRYDNIVSFDRGAVTVEVNGKPYSMEVLIAITKDGKRKLYDVPKFEKIEATPTGAIEKPLTGAMEQPLSNDNIAQESPAVNNTNNTQPTEYYASEENREHPNTVGGMQSGYFQAVSYCVSNISLKKAQLFAKILKTESDKSEFENHNFISGY